MDQRKTQILITFILSTVIILSTLIFKGDFYVNVYDSYTKEYLDMSYKDIKTFLPSQCVGTPGTGESGYYIFEPKIAFPGLITVEVKGYQPKKIVGFLGFNNRINIYLEKKSQE